MRQLFTRPERLDHEPLRCLLLKIRYLLWACVKLAHITVRALAQEPLHVGNLKFLGPKSHWNLRQDPVASLKAAQLRENAVKTCSIIEYGSGVSG